MSAREKSIEENSSVKINDYQKLVEEANFKKKQDNTATAQAYPMVKNLTIEKIKNELKHSSVDKSKGGESSRSLLTENTPSNRSSKGGLFEQLDEQLKEKIKMMIPQHLAHRSSFSFARSKPHMFDKEEITDQNIYNPIEQINTPRNAEKAEDANAKSKFFRQETKNTKHVTNSPEKSKHRLKSSQTVVSSRISIDGSYTEHYLEKSIDESLLSFDRSSFDVGERLDDEENVRPDIMLGQFIPGHIDSVEIPENTLISNVSFFNDEINSVIVGLSIELMNESKIIKFGRAEENEAGSIKKLSLDLGLKHSIGQVFAGGYGTHLCWIKIVEIHGSWVKSIGDDSWATDLRFWHGKVRFGKRIKEIQVQTNQDKSCIIAICIRTNSDENSASQIF